jgi:hypothetical protein
LRSDMADGVDTGNVSKFSVRSDGTLKL